MWSSSLIQGTGLELQVHLRKLEYGEKLIVFL